MENPHKGIWWQQDVIYQIFVRSYYDSNGDGSGDIQGIIQKLDYLQWLGIDALWISPVYESPMKDFGYDVADHKSIDPVFGTIADFQKLLGQVHARQMKLVLDLVPNHTSDQHPWFKQSRSSRDDPKRDWYLWQDAGPNGAPPTNWLSVFSGSAWEWDKATGQFYCHSFLKEQPDLNLRNIEVQQALFDIMRFWLDKGVDGFRIDAMWHLIKDAQWRDNPANKDYTEKLRDYNRLNPIYSSDRPEVHPLLQKIRSVTDEYPDKMLIGELYMPVEKLAEYYGDRQDEVHLPANLNLLFMDWKPQTIAEIITKYETVLCEGCWPNWALGNHDWQRILSRVGRDQSRVAAMLLLTARGTPIIYYGDEIGMSDADVPDDESLDPQGLMNPGKNLSRDPHHAPMQWDSGFSAGFTTAKPWMRIASDYEFVNVQQQTGKPGSLLELYRNLINLRSQQVSLRTGSCTDVNANEQTLSFIRKENGSDSFLIVLNFSDQAAGFNMSTFGKGTLVLSTTRRTAPLILEDHIEIAENEGLIIKINSDG